MVEGRTMSDTGALSGHAFLDAVKSRVAEGRFARQPVEWVPLALGAGILTGFVTCLVLALDGTVPILLAALANTLIIYSCQIVTHEAAHRNVFDSARFGAWTNDLVGYVFSIPLLWDFKTFQTIHLDHHRFTNDPKLDPQYRGNVVESWRVLYRKVTRFVRRLGRRDAAAGGDAPEGFPQPRSWFVFHGSVVLFFVLAPKLLLLVWLAPAWVATSLIVFIHSSMHTGEDGSAPALAKSRMVIGSGIWGLALKFAFLFQNYHLIHHLFPRLPYHKTARLSQEVFRDYGICGIEWIDFAGPSTR